MVNKFCKINYKNGEIGQIFYRLMNEDFEQIWLKLVNTTSCDSQKIFCVCQKHFTNKFLNTDDKLVSLMRKTNPFLTLKKDVNCELH